MRILVLGAGGIGGYFGAQLQHASGDVTFLVRPARASNLAANGLLVTSSLGDIAVTPKVITSVAMPNDIFDVVILSCKAYDLHAAIEAVAPAMGPDSVILPLLNGVAHLDALDARFGRERVLGGVAHISVAMSPSGDIEHLNAGRRLIFGSRHAPPSKHVAALAELFSAISADFTLSHHIEQDMWDKLTFISTLAAATCAMRASVGDILTTVSGETFIIDLFEECRRVAAANHHTPSPDQLRQYRHQLTEKGSTLKASMLRDVERNGPTEAEHILGDMVRRADAGTIRVPMLKLAYSHLQAYERVRTQAFRELPASA